MKDQLTLDQGRELARRGPRALKDPHSVEFAWQTVSWLKTVYQSKELELQRWEKAVAEARQYHIWDRVPPEQPYGSLDALLKEELGVTEDQARANIVALAEKAEPLAGHGAIGRGRDRGNHITSNERGTRSDYLTARIARDRPDILERMKAGEFKSVRAAAKEAGIVRDPTPLEILQRAWRKAGDEEREAFRQWMKEDEAS